MGKKKKKLKKKVGSRLEEGERAIVVCVGKKCAPRELSRAVVDDARAYVAEKKAAGETGKVRVALFGCLGICKKGPIAATLPRVHFSKRVDAVKVRKIIDELFDDARASDSERERAEKTSPASLEAQAAEAKRVGDDGQRAKAHGAGSEHGADRPAGPFV